MPLKALSNSVKNPPCLNIPFFSKLPVVASPSFNAATPAIGNATFMIMGKRDDTTFMTMGKKVFRGPPSAPMSDPDIAVPAATTAFLMNCPSVALPDILVCLMLLATAEITLFAKSLVSPNSF